MTVKYKSFKCDVDKSGYYPIITTSYNSLSEYIETLKQFKTNNPEHESFALSDSLTTFAGGSPDMAFCVDNSKLDFSLADFSQAAGAVAEKLAEKLAENKYFNDVTGLTFDVGDVLSGRPECWFNMEEQKNKRLDIIYHTSFDCRTDHKQVMNRGACLIGLIDGLKYSNVSLSLKTVDYAFLKGRYNTYTKNIINIDLDMISPDTLRFICCNPLFHRRLVYFEREILLHTKSLMSCRYGFLETYKPKKEDITNDVLIIGESFTPYTLEEGENKIKTALDGFSFGSEEPQIFTI